jgi:hypothetical protein
MFYVQSIKTKLFLHGVFARHDEWGETLTRAIPFKTPSDALNRAGSCSKTSRAHVVYWDGIMLWNVSLPKSK